MSARHILVVDDDALFRSSLTDALSMALEDVTVHAVENGAAALADIERRSPALVITDLQMPVMDGFELLARLTSRRVRAPIVLVTGFGCEQVRTQAQEGGAAAYFEKPIDLDAFIEAVRGLLEVPVGHVVGMTLAGFAQLLAMERKSCCVLVRADDREAKLYFDKGDLVAAETADAVGDEAALAALGWLDPVLEVGSSRPPSHARVSLPLSEVIFECARRQDESDRARPATAAESNLPSTDSDAFGADKKGTNMADVNATLDNAMRIDGAIAVALVDFESGLTLGTAGGGRRLNIDLAAAGNMEVVRAKVRVMKDLQLEDKIEDILITLGRQYHLIRPLKSHPTLFLYLAIDRDKGNLGLARLKLGQMEQDLKV